MVVSRSKPFQEGRVEPPDLTELLRRSRAGDAAAFDDLVTRYYRVVHNLAFRMLGQREAAEDATQVVFVKAWRGLPRFRGASGFGTWLHSIAVHECLNRSETKTSEASRVEALEDDRGAGPAAARSAEEAYADLVLRHDLHRAIARLPEKLRLAIVLHYYSDYSVKEIAETLGLPLRTVYSRLEMGRARLERELRSD